MVNTSRTPKKTETPKSQQVLDKYLFESDGPPPRKRFNSQMDTDVSMMDFLKEMKEDMAMQHSETRSTIKDLKDEFKSDLRGLKDELYNKFDAVEEGVKSAEAKADTNAKKLAALTARLNAIEQEKHTKSIDVTGLNNESIEKFKENPKALAKALFESFAIQLPPTAIERAYLRPIKAGAEKVLTVVMSTLNDKILVMQKKLQWKEKTTIYFNATMATETRKIFMYARKKVKEGKLKKVFLKSGKVYALLPNNETVLLTSNADVEQVTAPLYRRNSVPSSAQSVANNYQQSDATDSSSRYASNPTFAQTDEVKNA